MKIKTFLFFVMFLLSEAVFAHLEGVTDTSYFLAGVEHIVFGLEHLLFLVALLLLPIKFKHLFVLVSVFTLAYSISFVLSALNIVSIPALYIELLIAFSIVYIAFENYLEVGRIKSVESYQYPLRDRTLMTFFFGLIHGFGFSYILNEIGLGDQVASALLFFNLGVEVGLLIIVAIAFPILLFLFKRFSSVKWAQFALILSALVGLFWLVERFLTLLNS